MKSIKYSKTIFMLIFSLYCPLLAMAENFFIVESNVTITSYISAGYIEIKIPMYDLELKNELLMKDSYFSFNDIMCLDFRSSESVNGDANDWQNDPYEFDENKYYKIWAKKMSGAVKVFTSGALWEQDISSTEYTECLFQMVGSQVYATFKIYVAENLLGINCDCKVHLNPDRNEDNEGYNENDFDVTLPVTGISYAIPNASPDFSDTPGKYNATFTISSANTGSKYIWDVESYSSATVLSGNTATTQFDIADSPKTHTLYFYHKVSDWQSYRVSANLTLPAYQQPLNFAATDSVNGDTKVSWNIALSPDPEQTGDMFEVERDDNSSFTTGTIVSRINFNPEKTSYSFIDGTSKENINGTLWYRIRRTKTYLKWGWEVSDTASILKSMSHRYILNANAKLLENNIASITWNYDGGNVWTENSVVILERYNITTGGTKEVITIPADSMANRSYSEELFQMCNKFSYKIYVRPGSTKYAVQDALSVGGDNIVPIESGSLYSLNASKGYFSERIELEWETDGMIIDYFILKNRIYQSGSVFRQISQVTGTTGSEFYQFSDEQSTPGVIYEYQIIGVTKCADVTIYTDTMYAYGFRTPTGDIYGRVTFENGQAEENVEVRIESDEGVTGKSLELNSVNYATIDNASFLEQENTVHTVQAWLSPDEVTGIHKIFSKPGMYELGINSDNFYFTAGDRTITSNQSVSTILASNGFVHVSAVFSGDSLFIYVNGEKSDSIAFDGSVSGNSNQARIGENYTGIIDEMRIWNSALTSKEIKRDYNRYIAGGEQGLIAYWSFNYATTTSFYDRSYKSSDYNENHGSLNVATLNSMRIPSSEQLGYKGVTGTDGSYAIRSIPYMGNGTLYTIIPRLGIHQFEPREEVRFIGNGSETFTVNFTDKSSFRVTGVITYKGGTVPVQGVSFTIDGIAAMGKNGTILMTDAKGGFEIQVPVGIHEVIAKKSNHIFVNEGKITDSYLQNLNYQDEVLGVKLTDITKVRYIGRVGGGSIQESYPLGHSLSANNLADGIRVVLTTKNPAYQIASIDTTIIFEHFVPSSKSGTDWSKKDSVRYSQETITIYPNEETGEFIADIIPESFTLNVFVPGHDDIPGSGEDLDLTQSFGIQKEIFNYTDSLLEDSTWIKTQYCDTVYYQKSRKFIKRYAPVVRIRQVNPASNKVLPYFGNDTIYVNTLDGTSIEVPLYNANDNTYTLGMPVFMQGAEYKLKADIFEKYIYCNADGTAKEGRAPDEIPTQDARVNYINNIAAPDQSTMTVEADDKGVAYYNFNAGEPELTTAKRKITATIAYGNESSAVTIPWTEPFDAIVLGYKQTGNNFVTTGPDKVLMVLRDPPGSNSYSYLEKGNTHTESASYTGSVTQTGEDEATAAFKQAVFTFTGIGAGTINTATETEAGGTIGIVHEEEYKGNDQKKITTTITTRFQTSSDPSYVGADADVFIGYSTNLAFGSTNNITIVSKEQYGNGDGYQLYGAITPVPNDWYLVQKTGLGVAQTFGTLFAYPQRHIEEILLPELINLRNAILIQPGLYTDDQLQNIANQKDTVLVVSKLTSSDPNYGKSNDDDVFGNPDFTGYDGPSYKIYFPEENTYFPIPWKYDKGKIDTIMFLNQTIANWTDRLSDNEEAKINAELLQNYSFQGGSGIEYSEAYSTVKSHESTFSIMLGGSLTEYASGNIFGATVKLQLKESLKTTHGGTWSTEEDANHAKGFVLSESGSDYISVDVHREKDWDESSEEYDTGNFSEGNTAEADEKGYYSSFIFKTRAGATSCPYEGEYVAKYFEPGQQHVIDKATMQVEVPEIAVEKDFIENVPSGGTAYFDLYLRNNSEMKWDNWFTLQIVNFSNPYGAKMYIDGAPIGNGLDFMVPAGGTLVKTLEVTKGSVMNYDNLKLVLKSQCQDDINDTLTFSVHFTPSCSDVTIEKPGNNWTYNTKLPVVTVEGIDEHLMDVILTGFDVNYDSFNHIKLQYKSSAESDDGWKTLMKYYSDSVLYLEALENGNASFIDPSDAGKIKYLFKMDDLPDQRYDLRAVSVCLINNEEIENYSETISGIKDMLCPRLFGSPQPANGILTILDELRLNFNEPIAEGLLTKNNFQVTGIRNGAVTDHSVSVSFDGVNDYMETEFEKNMAGKDITVEMWIKPTEPQNAILLNHGNINESIGMALTADNYLTLFVGDNAITSNSPVPFEPGSWAHVAFVYSKEGLISGYYNFSEVISSVQAGKYTGIGNMVTGRNIAGEEGFFRGQMHNIRVWNKILTSGELQVNSLAKLSGNEPGLLAYYPMDRGMGDIAEDKARGANLLLNGCTWSVPAGRAVSFDGYDSNLKLNTGGSAVIKKSMDFTIEFWFKGEPGQTNATLLSNGRGDGQELGGSEYLFSIEINENSNLCFKNNGYTAVTEGNYLDNNWHHFAINAGRAVGRSQIYIDGNLVNYFDVTRLGGIASANMFMGARGWFAPGDAATLKLDNHFRGAIDELRIWNLYKYESQIRESSNVKLDGTEMGLLAYYPFEYYKEWQGRKELDFTLADMKIQKDPANNVPDAINYSATQISDIPSVKDKGPVSSLEFDFVVNKDALMIYLEETPEKIEKTIITLTVDGVQDVNGNENISPITWSAYIDRNMVRWSETELFVSKSVDEPAVFNVQAVNQSGALQNFVIRNMPSWMSITPSSGTINPNSSVNITIEIDEGLNIGTYNEMIYLVNSDNVAEVLELNVVSKGETPLWKVNPGDFKYNMQVYAKLRINNIFSRDPEDMIAAFADGKCVGVANVQYEERNDMWYAFLIVYSNEVSQSGITFRIWDASTGIVYLADPGMTINFANNSTVGTPAVPQIFDAGNTVYQDIDLSPGWNWISFNVKSPLLGSLNELLSDMAWDSSNFFKSEADNLSANYSVDQNKWIEESAISMGNTLMYKISTTVPQAISIAGLKIKPSSENIAVKGNQWTYIGYLPSVRLKVDEALAGYDAVEQDIIKSQDAFAMYSGNIGWVGSLTYMEPGKGYMIYRNGSGNVTLHYPDSEGTLKGSIIDLPAGFVSHDYPGNMNMVAVTDINPGPNDRILTFTGNELISETTIRNIDFEPVYFITIPGNGEQPLRFKLERDGQIIGVTKDPYNFKLNAVNGTLDEPVVLNFSSFDDIVNVYPNPVREELTVTLLTEKTGPVEIQITDITGRKIIVRRGAEITGGVSVTNIDCSNLRPGIYFARIIIDGKYMV
ncbi:MAG: T9SS type A sorting domain-containing protein, partial [Bacteroidales bacterium]|nr:T9SS type A sorting domain-containing protein [Bacteroidales bacterium]